jgi:predicted amidohydrolase YtcJ
MDREGLKGVYPSLGGLRSIRDIQDLIASLASKAKPGDWIVTMPIGEPPYYWDVPEILTEKRWPTRHELDAAAPNNPVFIRSIWGFWRHTLPLVSCANTEALRRAGITRDTISPVETVKIEKDANGDPTGVITEFDFQPLAELTWFRQAGGFTRVDRALGIPLAAQAYHAYGTTSVFEEHGVANELLRAYKDAYRDGKLTMRAALIFSQNWKAAAGTPLGPFMEAWAGWLGEPGLDDDWLKVAGLHFGIGRSLSGDLRASAAPYTGWAGFNYDTGLSRAQAKEVLLHCARNDIRAVALATLSPGLIDLYDEVDREIPLKGRRWVVGHISSLSPRDIEKVARMGLVVTPHTNRYIFKEAHLLQKKLPPERHREITPMRDLIDAGVNVGLVTDNVPVSLFWPIWEVVARLDRVTNEVPQFGCVVSSARELAPDL